MASAVVKVTIDDVNDNTPVFDRPVYQVTLVAAAARNLTSSSSSDASSRTEIAVVRATDADSGLCGLVFYAIIDGNDNGLFAVDSHSGNDLLSL